MLEGCGKRAGGKEAIKRTETATDGKRKRRKMKEEGGRKQREGNTEDLRAYILRTHTRSHVHLHAIS